MAVEIVDINTSFGAYPSQHADSTAESLVKMLASQGVQWCITLSNWGIYHNDMQGNAETIRACMAHAPLIPAATINPRDFWGQLSSTAELNNDAYEMFRFFPHIQHWPVHFAPFIEIVATLAKSPRKPIMISCREPGDATDLGRVLGDYPHPVILEGVSAKNLGEAILVLQAIPHFNLEIHSLHIPDVLPLLRDSFGIERILFGSDAPVTSLRAAVRYIQKSSLTVEEQEAVLGRNAMRIWHGETGA